MDFSPRYTHDAVADAVFLYLVDSVERGAARSSRFVPVSIEGASVTVVLDEAGRALGVEFLGASKLFSQDALEGFRRGPGAFTPEPGGADGGTTGNSPV
jgi:hypothetical protein